MPEVVEIDPVTGPGAEGARRATGGPGPVTGSRASDPDPEVTAKVERRRFPPAYRLRILKEVDACKRPGEVGALLRREGLYSSLLTNWPIAQGLERLYGSLDTDVARGLALRMDHGSQYLSDHFLKQIRYWGIHPSFGFVEEPETNGVAERWNRTLKEQAIHGRIFQNLEAVRAAVADFVERYNQTWRLEKLGYQTPIEAREEYELRQAA